jgi:hypothetical protein
MHRMSRRSLFLLSLFAVGCHTPLFSRAPLSGDQTGVVESTQIVNDATPDDGLPPARPLPGGNLPSSCAAPSPVSSSCAKEAEVCKEIHVTAPRQRVCVPRPGAAAAPQLIQEQVAQTRQVILVPQQVYVPFIQATNFGAVRVNGLQETQVFNAQAIAGVATGQGIAVGGNQFGVGPRSAEGAGTTQAISPEEARKCQEELKAAKAALAELTGQLMKLSTEMDQLKKSLPPK